ncbi:MULTISPECIES: phage major tail tube protein [unclassified Pseudomonas]|uniref:phage major tail tube protein n=1 Tax=unclassified Pseudomonas TaxID=196821 RepID=UPI00244A3897|nr:MULTISPECIES: phage major tail tube protein [unclassified Pseudomonas]MDH0894356.1 phage major tail tube protein [Pseudomonas sp. GD03875]MDH1063349.1 phage major tail tube protein [Pseudomonas sp. GD03985]
MAGFSAHRITNGAIYMDGNSFFAKNEEIELGSVKAVMSDFQGMGMVGLIELPDGIDKLTGKIIWNSKYADAAKKTATPLRMVQLQCRSSVEVYNSQGKVKEIPLVTFLTVQFTEYQLGNHKPRENAKYESPFSATYVRQILDGEDILELDYLANIYKVGGIDQLDQYRQNLGLS